MIGIAFVAFALGLIGLFVFAHAGVVGIVLFLLAIGAGTGSLATA